MTAPPTSAETLFVPGAPGARKRLTLLLSHRQRRGLLVGGIVAARLGLPAIVGYLLAGVAVGPFTPGFVADTHLAPQLAELGVILLMFGVGIHFSPRDLLAVRAVAVPGAVGQIVVATGLTVGVAW